MRIRAPIPVLPPGPAVSIELGLIEVHIAVVALPVSSELLVDRLWLLKLMASKSRLPVCRERRAGARGSLARAATFPSLCATLIDRCKRLVIVSGVVLSLHTMVDVLPA